MASLIKNIHLFIIGLGLFNLYNLWLEKSEQIDNSKNQVETLRNNIDLKTKNKKELQEFFRDIEEAKDRIERVAQAIEKAQQQLPSEINDGEIMGFITKKADELNIREINIAPDIREDDKGFYFIRKYIFKAKGTYVQFLILFENIAEYKRILNIGSVSFNRLNTLQRSRFQVIDGQIEILAYRYNTSYKEDRGIETIDKNLKEKPAKRAKKNSGGED